VRVLVTGTKGYLGCCPGAPTLFEDGHDVVGDVGPFWKGELQ
jgi:nucleoside-diphosphate-sugar epimerase